MSFQKMSSNRVGIIGRPNVGKSTLFNVITGTRKAIVKNQPGVTRDIQIEPADWSGVEFEVMDTGGITEAEDIFSKLIREQVHQVLNTCDCIIVVMDGRAGLCPEDRDIIRVAKESGRPFVIVVNKVDRRHDEDVMKAEFYEFGSDVIAASFEQRRNIDEILDWCLNYFTKEKVQVREGLTLAIVGKPNVGKSSLVNQLLGENRMIVSAVAGTTIDAIDSEMIYNDKKYVLIDTAGIRRQSRTDEDVEVISSFKSKDAIHRADMVLILVDVTEGPSDQDATLARLALEEHKAVLLVANKADIAEEEMDAYRQKFRAQVEHVFHHFVDIPICFISAKTTMGIKGMFEKIEEIWSKMTIRISTRELNEFFFNTIRGAPAPVAGNVDVKFYYITQTKQVPPSFIAFANRPDGVDTAYRRFVINKMKEEFALEGIPLRIFVMKLGGGSRRSHESNEGDGSETMQTEPNYEDGNEFS